MITILGMVVDHSTVSTILWTVVDHPGDWMVADHPLENELLSLERLGMDGE